MTAPSCPRVRLDTLVGRVFRVGSISGSGDPDAPYGDREEDVTLIDVDTGERFELIAKRTRDGWPYLLVENWTGRP